MSEADRESWFGVADQIVAYAAYLRTRSTFEGIVATDADRRDRRRDRDRGVHVGRQPPEKGTQAPVLDPRPVAVQVSLTDQGRDALADALGGEEATGAIAALSIGGSETAPKVVTLPDGTHRRAVRARPGVGRRRGGRSPPK